MELIPSKPAIQVLHYIWLEDLWKNMEDYLRIDIPPEGEFDGSNERWMQQLHRESEDKDLIYSM